MLCDVSSCEGDWCSEPHDHFLGKDHQMIANGLTSIMICDFNMSDVYVIKECQLSVKSI